MIFEIVKIVYVFVKLIQFEISFILFVFEFFTNTIQIIAPRGKISIIAIIAIIH